MCFMLILCLLPALLQPSAAVRYVALGDSYTICTGAEQQQSWPVLLSKDLEKQKVMIQLVANPAHNGWTTKDVIEKELPILDKSKPTFVTLLIGVNDWVQGVNETDFRYNLIFILDHVQAHLPDKKKLILITIPDFGVTPTGARYGNDQDISAGINSFNRVIKEEALKRGLTMVDIFAISKKMYHAPDLTAADGLHPSAKEYLIWETLIFPAAYALLKK